MTKVTMNLDPEVQQTGSLVDLFMSIAVELEMRGEFTLSPTLPRTGPGSVVEQFMDRLPMDPLEVWAKAAMAEAVRRGTPIAIARPRDTPAITTRLNPAERAMAEGGQKIPAIKAYRDRIATTLGGCSLREAKDEVDAWATNAQQRRAEEVARMLAEPLLPGPGSPL